MSITDGVFAINKPAATSSAQSLRDLQSHFNSSNFYASWLAQAEEKAKRSHQKGQYRGKRRKVQVKLGHGGTLDPAATGVLIVGVGSGTKALQKFLDGTKTYEAVVVFGAATDSYDADGKVVARKPFGHVTKSLFEEALNQFRGEIKQKPPIFSALWMDGKRLYEYAREGKEPPRQIEERSVRSDKLELVEWMHSEQHNYSIPSEEADQTEKELALKMFERTLSLDARSKEDKGPNSSGSQRVFNMKRRHSEQETGEQQQVDSPSAKRAKSHGAQDVSELAEEEADAALSPPAARIRMTVSSGFYVRSLCHDLGIALGSWAFMASLVRTRQSDFELGKNVLDWGEFSKGEDVWAPQLEKSLAEWERKQHPFEQQQSGAET